MSLLNNKKNKIEYFWRFLKGECPCLCISGIFLAFALIVGLLFELSILRLIIVSLFVFLFAFTFSCFLLPSLTITIIAEDTETDDKDKQLRLLIDGRSFNYSLKKLPIQQKVILWKRGKYNITLYKWSQEEDGAPTYQPEQLEIQEAEVWSKHAHAFEIKVKV